MRIKAATASAYFVKAGEYIQVIDVSGRQCTDFQAFAARKLDKGQDLALDATVTRTLLGAAIRTPGLAFQGLRPGIRAAGGDRAGHRRPARCVRDRLQLRATTTTWAIPATSTARRISTRALAPYGIAPRKGWEALNYFYNTNIDARTSSISTSRGRGPATMC